MAALVSEVVVAGEGLAGDRETGTWTLGEFTKHMHSFSL